MQFLSKHASLSFFLSYVDFFIITNVSSSYEYHMCFVIVFKVIQLNRIGLLFSKSEFSWFFLILSLLFILSLPILRTSTVQAYSYILSLAWSEKNQIQSQILLLHRKSS